MGPLTLDPANPRPVGGHRQPRRQGRVVAMVGGHDFNESEFNLATS